MALVVPSLPVDLCGCDVGIYSKSQKRKSRMKKNAILRSKTLTEQVHALMMNTESRFFDVSEKSQRLAHKDDSDSRLVLIQSLLQEVSLRLGNVEQRLAISFGYPDCCDTAVPYGIPAEFLEMQCKAARKVQSWFRRNVKSMFASRQ